METTISIECHDCGGELFILDQYDDMDYEKCEYCAFCGSTNIEVSEAEA